MEDIIWLWESWHFICCCCCSCVVDTPSSAMRQAGKAAQAGKTATCSPQIMLHSWLPLLAWVQSKGGKKDGRDDRSHRRKWPLRCHELPNGGHNVSRLLVIIFLLLLWDVHAAFGRKNGAERDGYSLKLAI